MGREGDEKFEELFKYYPAVMAMLLRLGFEREDARDLAQQVFLRVYQHMDAYRKESKWRYLERTTRNLAYNAIRDTHAAKRQGIPVAMDDILELEDDVTAAPDVAAERGEHSQRLRKAIGQLGPKEQTSVLLQLAGNSYEESAKVLGISVSALKSRLHAARRRLRELLGEPEGLGGDDDDQ